MRGFRGAGSVVAAGLTLALGRQATGDAFVVEDKGTASAYVSYTSKTTYAAANYAPSDWAYVLAAILTCESSPNPTLYPGGGVSTPSYTKRWKTAYRSYAMANRVEDQVRVDMTALSPANGYMTAWLEWPIDYAEDTAEPLSANNVTPLCRLQWPQEPGAITVNIVDAWPDWAILDQWHGKCISYYLHPPTLKAEYQVGEVQPVVCTGAGDRPSPKKGDPVNCIDGNVSIEATDLAIPALGAGLELRRYYGSAHGAQSALGPGWTHSYGWRIWETNTIFRTVTNRWLVLDTGEERHWKPLNVVSGGHETVRGLLWNYTTNAAGAYSARLPGGVAYGFDTNGHLSSVLDAWGNGVTLGYTNTGSALLPLAVQHTDGRSLRFQYSGERLVRVDSPSTNLWLDYAHNSAGELTNIVRHAGAAAEATRLDWSAAHVVTQLLDAAGSPRQWDYSGSRGVRSSVGTNRWYDISFNYAAAGQGRTFVTVDRGDTNATQAVDYHPVRRKIQYESLQAAWPACGGTVQTNQVLFRTGDRFGVFTNNWFYNSMIPRYAQTAISVPGWTGTRYAYDDYGNLTGVNRYDWDGTTQWRDSTAMAYDSGHRLTNWAYAYNATPSNRWSLSWDTNWSTLASLTDPEGRRSDFVWTNGALAAARAYPDGTNAAQSLFFYATNGLLRSATNANGHGVGYLYDGYGYPTSILPQAGPRSDLVWNELGHLEEVTLAGTILGGGQTPSEGPRKVLFDTDPLGRVRQITWPDSSFESFAYDGVGNVTNHTDAAGRSTRYEWLPTRKLAAVTRTLSGATNQELSVRFEYDRQFNAVRIRDELGRSVESYRLDIQDRPVSISNIESQQMTIAYGLEEFVKSVTRFDGTVVTPSYGADGQVSQVVLPGETNRFSYYRNGLLGAAANRNGSVSNVYDQANRLTSVRSIQGPLTNTLSYALDAVGNPTNIHGSSFEFPVSRAYDAAERLASIQHPASSFLLNYNATNGLISSVEDTNSGLRAEYRYDGMDRLASITWKDGTGATLSAFEYEYNAAGLITQLSESGFRFQTSSFTYDGLDRLTGETQADGYGQTLFEASYAYDAAGNRTQKVITAGSNTAVTINYALSTFNGLSCNRLGSWSVAGTDLTARVTVSGAANEPIGTNDRFGALYVSNAVGGALKPTVSGSNFWANGFVVGLGTQQVVAAIRDVAGNMGYATNTVFLTTVTNGSYAYSTAGCVTNIRYRGVQYEQSLALAWDGEYRLTDVRTNGVVAERYKHDALGRRIWTSNATEVVWHVYDGADCIADLDATGGLKRAYLYGPGIDNILAMLTYGGTASVPSVFYYVKDHLGTVRALVDASGTNVVEAYHFDAWGRVTAYNGAGVELLASAIGNRYLFQGREFSWASGLYYFRARWYDPVTGRWLSNDPIGVSGGLNQYRALRCSPIEHVDRDGRRVEHFGSVSVFDIARFDAAMASLSEHGGTVGKALVRAARDESTTVEVFWGSDGPMAARGRGVSTLWLVRSGRLFGAEEDEDCPLRIDESTSRPEVVLAHELSHSLVGLDDPHNVDLVENAVRLSCGEALRTTYRGLPICLGRYDRPRFLDEALLRDFLRSNPDRVLP